MRKSIPVRRRRAVYYYTQTSHIILQYVYIIYSNKVIYIYIYIIIIYSLRRVLVSAADAVVSILYFVLSCHAHTQYDVYVVLYIHAEYSTCVPYGYDILLSLCYRTTHTYEQRVAKTTVAPRLGG